jgi:hypothetical protein
MSDEIVQFSNSERVGKAFGGNVHLAPINEIDHFFKENGASFSASGKASFLKAMSIPPSFFEDRNFLLQQDLIVDTKEGCRLKHDTEHLAILENDGIIDYVAPLNNRFGWEDPHIALELDHDYWQLTADRVSEGILKFAHLSGKDMLPGDYFVTGFFNLPIFYSAPFSLGMGMFKLVCTNGMMDRINVKSLNFSHKEFDAAQFSRLVDTVRLASNDLQEEYQTFMEALGSMVQTPESAINFVNEKMKHPDTGKMLLPKSLVKEVAGHFDHIVRGDDFKPANSPTEIKSHLDILDTFTFYSNKVLPSGKAADRADSLAFQFFYEMCCGMGHVGLKDCNLKQHYIEASVSSSSSATSSLS